MHPVSHKYYYFWWHRYCELSSAVTFPVFVSFDRCLILNSFLSSLFKKKTVPFKMPSKASAQCPTWQHNNSHQDTKHAKEIIRKYNSSANEHLFEQSGLPTVTNEPTRRIQNTVTLFHNDKNDGLVFKCLPPPNIDGSNRRYIG